MLLDHFNGKFITQFHIESKHNIERGFSYKNTEIFFLSLH